MPHSDLTSFVHAEEVKGYRPGQERHQGHSTHVEVWSSDLATQGRYLTVLHACFFPPIFCIHLTKMFIQNNKQFFEKAGQSQVLLPIQELPQEPSSEITLLALGF